LGYIELDGRVWALPFLTALAPSERFAREQGCRHKKPTDWARQLLLLLARWLPERRLIAVADSSYAVIELLGSGAAAGNRNALKHGSYSHEAIEFRHATRELLREAGELIEIT
jgi:hypothetical protein